MCIYIYVCIYIYIYIYIIYTYSTNKQEINKIINNNKINKT